MKPMTARTLWLSFAVLSASMAQAEVQSQEVQEGIAQDYLEARAKTMQAGAQAADVERVLSSCTPSVVYEHPRMGIRLEGVETLRSGMLGFLGSSRNASITIKTSLRGRDVVVAQTDVAFDAQNTGKWEPVKRSQTWVFEFQGSRIKRIIEYW